MGTAVSMMVFIVWCGDCSEHDGVYCVAVVETAASMMVFIVW